MVDDIKTIRSVGNELLNSLKELTLNYRLGFGSFSDKPVMPFIQTDPQHLQNPCLSEGRTCQPPFDFKHLMTLTNKTDTFIEQFDEGMFTGNLDNLDGGLDALMQVVVCWKKINWSKKARRIILMATDSFFHVAGDGKLAGIVKPNDGKCHLNKQGIYTGDLTYDYPSISQIHKALYNNKVRQS